MRQLGVMIEEEVNQQMNTTYGLEHLWILTSAVISLGGQKLNTPSYVELTHPELTQQDNRTAEEIFADIDNQLTIIIAREEANAND